MRYHSIYGVYGISVFAVRGATVDGLAQQAPLVRFDRNPRPRRSSELWPSMTTGRCTSPCVLPGSVEKNRHLVGRALA